MIRFKDGPHVIGFLLIATGACGCSESAAPMREADTLSRIETTEFDSTAASSIRGRVTWAGAIPVVKPLEVRSLIFASDGAREKWMAPNPNAPVVDPTTRGVGNAVVFLRGVDPQRARPWHHPPVRIEQKDRRYQVYQGETTSPYGFVRRGDRVEMVSRDPFIHVLHADGAAYFSFAFPDRDSTRGRTLSQSGIVELTSGAGYFAMRAYLFVDESPYYARADAEGRFVLENVPPGRYEVVAWMPNWVEARRDREPETGVFSRLFFRPPVEKAKPAHIQERTETEVEFTISAKDFLP